MFTQLNGSGLVPDFNVDGNVLSEISNDTLLIFQDVLVQPGGNINVSVASNLDGLLDTDLLNVISNSSLILNSPSTTSAPPVTRPWLLSDQINLENISDDDLKALILTNIPNIDGIMLEKISGILKSHGGSINLTMLDDILRNIEIPGTQSYESDELHDKIEAALSSSTTASDDDPSVTVRASSSGADDKLIPDTSDSSTSDNAATANKESATETSITDLEKIEEMHGGEKVSSVTEDLDDSVEMENNTGSDSPPGLADLENVTDIGQELHGRAETTTPYNLAGDSHQLLSEDDLVPETSSTSSVENSPVSDISNTERQDSENYDEEENDPDIIDKVEIKTVDPYLSVTEPTTHKTPTSSNHPGEKDSTLDQVTNIEIEEIESSEVTTALITEESGRESTTSFPEEVSQVPQTQSDSPITDEVNDEANVKASDSSTSSSVSRKVEIMENNVNDDTEESDEQCYRRYSSRVRKPDISYYNTTARTRVLTAICLEGIRCGREEDWSRCRILHSKCNQEVDTDQLSFKMRLALSECRVEDILCHLGHNTPVMCCQDKYSECVQYLTSDSDQIPLVESREDPEKPTVVDQITNQLFNTSIFSPSDTDLPADLNNLFDLDNETLPIFQDFVIVLDDSQGLNNTLLTGDGTINNILTNLNTSDFRIIFDPNSTVIGLDEEEIGIVDESILTQIKDQINSAVSEVANVCSNNICIQNIDDSFSTNMSVINTSQASNNASGLITLETKNDTRSQLEQCLKAQFCNSDVSCMFSTSKCVQLSNIDVVPQNTRKDLIGCKIVSLKCLLKVGKLSEQDQCRADYKRCTAMLGVDIYGGSIVNFIHPEPDHSQDGESESGEEITKTSLIHTKQDEVLRILASPRTRTYPHGHVM